MAVNETAEWGPKNRINISPDNVDVSKKQMKICSCEARQVRSEDSCLEERKEDETSISARRVGLLKQGYNNSMV